MLPTKEKHKNKYGFGVYRRRYCFVEKRTHKHFLKEKKKLLKKIIHCALSSNFHFEPNGWLI